MGQINVKKKADIDAEKQAQDQKNARRAQIKQNLQSRPAHTPPALADQIQEIKEYLGLIDGD